MNKKRLLVYGFLLVVVVYTVMNYRKIPYTAAQREAVDRVQRTEEAKHPKGFQFKALVNRQAPLSENALSSLLLERGASFRTVKACVEDEVRDSFRADLDELQRGYWHYDAADRWRVEHRVADEIKKRLKDLGLEHDLEKFVVQTNRAALFEKWRMGQSSHDRELVERQIAATVAGSGLTDSEVRQLDRESSGYADFIKSKMGPLLKSEQDFEDALAVVSTTQEGKRWDEYIRVMGPDRGKMFALHDLLGDDDIKLIAERGLLSAITKREAEGMRNDRFRIGGDLDVVMLQNPTWTVDQAREYSEARFERERLQFLEKRAAELGVAQNGAK